MPLANELQELKVCILILVGSVHSPNFI